MMHVLVEESLAFFLKKLLNYPFDIGESMTCLFPGGSWLEFIPLFTFRSSARCYAQWDKVRQTSSCILQLFCIRCPSALFNSGTGAWQIQGKALISFLW